MIVPRYPTKVSPRSRWSASLTVPDFHKVTVRLASDSNDHALRCAYRDTLIRCFDWATLTIFLYIDFLFHDVHFPGLLFLYPTIQI